MTATKNISIRIGVVDGDKVRKELSLTGETGAKALSRIRDATKPATKSLTAINVVAEQARSGMASLSGSAGSLGSSLSRLGTFGLAAAASLGALSLVLGHGLKEFKEAEHAFNQLNAALSATDFASGVTAKQILLLGEALERTTLFKKTDIENAAASLTTFGNIQGKVFERAIRLSADLAVRLGIDVPSSAEMLGRALEKPEDGLGRLARKFSDLSVAQKESIASFIKQGDTISAQTVILDHLESKVKGLAEAQTHGLTGSLNTLSDAWNNFSESLGRVAARSKIVQYSLGTLTRALEFLRKAIDPTLLEQKKALEDTISRLENSLLIFSAPHLAHIKEELKKVNEQIASEQKQQEEEQARARESAATSALKRKNNQLLELQRQYLKEHEELTLSSREKILKEHGIRREQIEALGQGNADNSIARSALHALNLSTHAKLDETNKKAIDEINQALLQTKPSYEASKKALDDWKANLVKNLSGAVRANQKYLEQIEQIYSVKLKEIYDKSLLDSNDWASGAIRALDRYSSAALNAAANVENLFSTAAKKIEDTLTDMMTAGELSLNKLRDMAISVRNDLLRIFIRENVTGPLAGAFASFLKEALGAMFGGSGTSAKFFHEGGVVGMPGAPTRLVPSNLFYQAPRLHSGLAPDEFPAILQRGEIVLPRNFARGNNLNYKYNNNNNDNSSNRNNNRKGNNNINIVFNVSTPNAQSFTESRGQIMAILAAELDRYKRRNS